MLNQSITPKLSFLFVLSALICCSNAWATPSAFNADHPHGIFGHHGHHSHHFSSTPASTTPFDVSIVEGKGVIRQFGDVTVIKIFSPDAILDGNLSTNLGDIIKIIMRSSAGSTLLESTTGLATIANGLYWSNGNLAMLNPSGFVFGPNAEVRAANIFVSTLNISHDDFLAGISSGKFHFSGQGSYIINDGKLIAQPGGYIALLSGAISNEGVIQARLGNIVLASGDGMTLTTVALDDRNTIFVVVDKAVENDILGPNGEKINNAIGNKGIISANGGSITLTAKSLNKIFDYSINNSGIIEAKSLSSTQKGDVVLKAEGAISSTGVLESSSLLERGATFQVGGVFNPGVADIKNADNAIIYSADTDVSGSIMDAVNIIIDPNVTLTMTGDTSFTATAGSFLMDPSSTINGEGYNLTITAGDDVTLGNINNVNSLTATATNGNLTSASTVSSNGGNIDFTAGQDIIQDGAINTNNGNYTAHAPNYILDYTTVKPSINPGNGIVDIFAPTVAEIGPGWGFSSNTATNYDWDYIGGLRGASLLEFGYYFLLGKTIVYVPSVSAGPGGNIDNPVSGTQQFINIDVNNDAFGGSYIVEQYQTGPVNYWYSNPALNVDGFNHVITDSLSDETAQLESTASVSNDGSSNVLASIPGIITLATANPNGTIYNWEDSSLPQADGDYNDVIIQSFATTMPALIVTAQDQSNVYGNGGLPSSTAVDYTGFINGDTFASLTTQPTVSTTATAASGVGAYSITASGAVDPNYSIFYVPGTLSITPASLTITANNQSIVFGAPSLPTLTVGYTGFVNGDTSASLTTRPIISTTATPTSSVGNYAITVSGAVDPNYTISYVAGTLAITPGPLTPPIVPGTPSLPSFNAFDVLATNNKVNKIIYETLSPYQLSTNTIQQPLVYFYHPLTPIDQSAFNGISLDEGAYDFIEHSLHLNKLPSSYYGM